MLIPASSACLTSAVEACWSRPWTAPNRPGLVPKVIAPRHSSETSRPVLPRRLVRMREILSLVPDLAGAAHQPFVRRQPLERDRAAGVEPPGRDPDLGAQAELAAIGELARSVVHD